MEAKTQAKMEGKQKLKMKEVRNDFYLGQTSFK